MKEILAKTLRFLGHFAAAVLTEGLSLHLSPARDKTAAAPRTRRDD